MAERLILIGVNAVILTFIPAAVNYEPNYFAAAVYILFGILFFIWTNYLGRFVWQRMFVQQKTTLNPAPVVIN